MVKKKKIAIAIGTAIVTAVLFSGLINLCSDRLTEKIKYQLCTLMLREYAPVLTAGSHLNGESGEHSSVPVYETQTESSLDYDKILAENQREKEKIDQQKETVKMTKKNTVQKKVQKKESISLEKLNDFDYLIQHFYTVDKTTTINSRQLSAKKLLAKDCTIKKTKKKQPQILIYHTHSQETYRGYRYGDQKGSVMVVGDRLTKILEETYGYQVLHHKEKYDVENRDHAYNVAAPHIQKLLKKNPSIEVVIDLHRDAVGENSHLVTTQNGKKMAQIMFFNGLSKNTSTGEINYLRNPYIQDNLAFSLKLQIAAKECYPGFSRNIYLKSYRYNMHFCPKSTLIEVGAQNNSLKEALNAMEPLAAVLDQVLSGK